MISKQTLDALINEMNLAAEHIWEHTEHEWLIAGKKSVAASAFPSKNDMLILGHLLGRAAMALISADNNARAGQKFAADYGALQTQLKAQEQTEYEISSLIYAWVDAQPGCDRAIAKLEMLKDLKERFIAKREDRKPA